MMTAMSAIFRKPAANPLPAPPSNLSQTPLPPIPKLAA
jgi:hypothetical protein